MESNSKPNNVYIGALKLRNIKCFKGEHIIDFTDKEGKLHQWTVIIGNNNTGKTTILRAIADLEPYPILQEVNEKDERKTLLSLSPYNLNKRGKPQYSDKSAKYCLSWLDLEVLSKRCCK
ncbi:MAG: AAA family ATPase [Saprospiraceae bacterium]